MRQGVSLSLSKGLGEKLSLHSSSKQQSRVLSGPQEEPCSREQRLLQRKCFSLVHFKWRNLQYINPARLNQPYRYCERQAVSQATLVLLAFCFVLYHTLVKEDDDGFRWSQPQPLDNFGQGLMSQYNPPHRIIVVRIKLGKEVHIKLFQTFGRNKLVILLHK